MVQLPKFKVRASCAGEIMGNMKNSLTPKQEEELALLIEKGSKSKKREELEAKRDAPEELPAGAKTYCFRWVKEQLFQRQTMGADSKYTMKGNEVEDESIDFLSGYHFESYRKNEESFEDEHFTGTPDIIHGDEIIDMKNSYDFTTFPLFDKGIKNKMYKYQGLVYMALTGRSRFRLVYTLMNLPPHMISEEARKIAYGSEKLIEDVYMELQAYHTYDGLDDKLRIKEFFLNRDELEIKNMRSRVELCRKFINEEVLKMIGG